MCHKWGESLTVGLMVLLCWNIICGNILPEQSIHLLGLNENVVQAQETQPAAVDEESGKVEGDSGTARTEEKSTSPESDPEKNSTSRESDPERVEPLENAEGEKPSDVEDEKSEPVNPTAKEMFQGGGYVSLLKVILVMLVYLFWVKTSDWVNIDAQNKSLNHTRWNPIIYGTFLGTFLIFMLIPLFWVGYFMLLCAYFAPLITYIVKRNEKVQEHEKVLTRAHLRYVFSNLFSKVGVKVSAEAKDKHESGPPIKLNSYGGTQAENEKYRILARAHEGFRKSRELLADGMKQWADTIMLDFSQAGVAVKYQVDGVWHNGAAIEREIGDPALEALKIVCGLKPEERRLKQTGKFKATFTYDYTFPEDRLKIKQLQAQIDVTPEEEVGKLKDLKNQLRKAKEEARKPEKRDREVVGTLTAQGTKTGERVLIQFEVKQITFKSLEELGMRDKIQETLLEQIAQPRGIILLSAPPLQGLRTTTNLVLHKTDRFMREFVAVTTPGATYESVENVGEELCQDTDPSAQVAFMRRLFLKEPNVVVMRDILSPEVLNSMMDELEENRVFITTNRARDCAEAILRVMALKCDRQKWAASVSVVLCQRLVRKLCEHCKEGYYPSAPVRQQLGIPEGRAFYKPPAVTEDGEICPECRGLGYKGRTAIYELAVIGETTRLILSQQPNLELVRKALKKDGNRTMMEEGILLVAKGVTSMQELKRVLET